MEGIICVATLCMCTLSTCEPVSFVLAASRLPVVDHDDVGAATLAGDRKGATQRKGLNVKVTAPSWPEKNQIACV